MTSAQKISLFLLRISIGWLFLYAGVTKIMDPAWSAVGYMSGAVALNPLYVWLSSPTIVPVVDFLNMWGLTLIGISLIIGLWVRWSAPFGILMMALYYIPILMFPYVGEHSYIVDEHIIYIFVLTVLVVFRAGRMWGIDGRIS